MTAKGGAEGEVQQHARVLALWEQIDREHGTLHAEDEATIRSTEPVRSLIVDLFHRSAPARDLFNACARLGQLMADAGASPSFASATLDGLARAFDSSSIHHDASRVSTARASLIEGYVAALRDAERGRARAMWEYPACAVPLSDGSVAIACGFPVDEREPLRDWAERVAGALVKAKVRRIVLSGRDESKRELEGAASLVGIDCGAPKDTAESTEETGERRTTSGTKHKSWLRLPWRR